MTRLESLYSSQVTAMAGDAVAPAQVQGLGFTVEQGKVILTWSAVTTNSDASPLLDLSGYRVFRKKLAGDAFVQIGQTASNVETFEDSSMKDGASYIYAVAAFDDEATPQEGLKSSDLAVKTIPSVPQDLASAAFDSKVTLTWTSVKDEADAELNENLAGYAVYRSEVDGSGYVLVDEVTADVETFDDLTVENGTQYFYVVTSFDNSL